MSGMKTADIFDGTYSITEDGRLYSNRTKKWLKPATDKYGYFYYVVSIKGVRTTIKVHRAVALSFITNKENKPTVDHINGDRKDNRIENLRWATWKEQQENDITKKRSSVVQQRTDYRAMGAKRNFGRKKVKAISKHGECLLFDSLKEASCTLGINMSKASECANGKRKATGGYVICYV